MRLGDVCEITSSKRIFAHEYRNFGVPFYRGKEIIEKQANKSISNELFIEETRYNDIKTKFGVPKEGDLLLTSVGTLGVPYVVKNERFYFKDGNITWFRDFQKATSKFIYYWLLSPICRQQIDSKCIGSTQKALTIDALLNFEIDLPPLETQRAIASTLSALDDKIAVNNKINHNLEQTARAIFKSWFVDFEPWGGVMPEDWETVTLGDLCVTITKGTTPTTLKKQFVAQGVNFIKAESILDDHSLDFSKLAFIDDETNVLLSRSIIREKDILFTIAGTLGRFTFVETDLLPANTNQAVAIIRTDTAKINPATLYSFFVGGLHSDFYTKNIQQAVQANLSLTTIKSLPLLLPPSETLLQYSEIVEPLIENIFRNHRENRRLIIIRDTLLPRLMSGEISL